MKKLLFVLLLISLLFITSCVGQVNRLPQDGSLFPDPIIVTPPFNLWMNTNFLGQVWNFQSIDGTCFTYMNINQVPPSNYYPTGSIDLHISKSSALCYWSPGDAGAVIDFVLSPYDGWLGSFNSKGWVAYFPGGSPFWCPYNPCSQQVQPSSSAVPMPYMAVPAPTLAAGSTVIYDTSYAVWFYNGGNFDAFDIGPPANPFVPWKTIFSIDFTYSTTGWARVEAFEGTCGHEIWYYSSRGIERIEFPNDGSASCIPNPPGTTIVRTN